jgi:hypothetical protein
LSPEHDADADALVHQAEQRVLKVWKATSLGIIRSSHILFCFRFQISKIL